MSTPSSQNDDQPIRDFFGHRLNQTLESSNPLQQQQPHLQPFLCTNNNIAIQQQTAVIQQQPALAPSRLSIATSQNPAPGSVLQAPPHPSQFVHWPNPLMGNASFLQHQSQTPQTPDVQQQQLNDFLFNIHAQAAYAAAATVPTAHVPSTATQQETYTVLRVGKGNFLKIYHCPENAMGNVQGETPFAPLPSYNHNQNTSFHHANSQGSPVIQPPLQQQQSQSKITGTANSPSAPVFNSYELFSSSTFTQLPTAEMPPLLLLGPAAKPQTMRTDDIRSSEQANIIETSNMILHNMPNSNKNNSNWTYNHVTSAPVYVHDNLEQKEVVTHNFAEHESTLANNNVNVTLEMATNDHNAIPDCHQQQIHLQDPSLPKDNAHQNASPSVSAIPLLLTPSLKNEIPRQEAPKKRIVAEVKPMRMTYSDVLSKLNNQTQSSQQNNYNNSSMKTNTPSTTSVLPSQRNQQKSLKVDTNIVNNSRRITDDSAAIRTAAKKSPMHENKENQQQQQAINNKLNNPKRSQTTTIFNSTNNNLNSNNIGSTSNKSATTQKNIINSKINNPTKSNFNGSNNVDNQQSKKHRSNKNSDIQNNAGKNCSLLLQRSSGSNSSSTSSTNNYNSTNNTYARKPKSTNSGNFSSSTGQQRSRYQNNTNASYSYSSTRRSRNNISYGTSSLNNSSSVNGSGSNRNYELVKLFLRAWYTYTLKILIWLFYLVYDIVVLGCSILYERLIFAYNSGATYAKHLYKELKENSNKPGIWFKNCCRKFDGKFSKTSKWAIWRKFFKKNPPEATSESIKTGKLPATGDEAMHQLLNCKGKDAYSILGVPPNSSQEQIRKHYKKIAVLVHPDKNKQAGAEEAFKVLQRAFELIGEPENRNAYDQSLAEALHAEKAWTELHDLLSQLQTKITEAANTIRCSTCGLRHPRKITERPHYAARECASCKIRHSAREGDIWAETSMLGLRWKYLALMEGKVYDITEWANCQKGALAHLEPNSHMVQYRIVRGAQHQHQQKQQTQQQQPHQQHQQQRTGSQYPGTGGVSGKFKCDNIPPSEASLHEFLDNLYSGQHPQQQQNTSANAGSSRRRSRRN